MTAADRARQALAQYEGTVAHDEPAVVALRDLLAEIDAHYVDLREHSALRAIHKASLTAADALRAAREASRDG